MSRLPTHPGTNDEPSHTSTPTDRIGPRTWTRILVVAVVLVLVGGMVVLHVTGVVGPGSH